MEFIGQIEQLFLFFEKNLSKTNLELVFKLKEKYNNDYNLIGSFVKDFLTLKNDYIECESEKVFDGFVKYFLNKTETIGENETMIDFYNLALYYLVLIFEKKFEYNTIDNEIIGYVETINLFFAMELYPYLLNKFDKFLNLKIDRNIFSSLLKSLVDIVVERNIKSINDKIDLSLLDYEINKMLLHKEKKARRLAG